MSKILVVDDNREVCEMLMMVLEAEGHTVMTAESGADATSMFESWNPELVVTDIHMPILNGLELIRRIRLEGRSKNVPIIGITAYPELGLDLALKAGATLSFSKPINMQVFVDHVQRLLRSDSMQGRHQSPPQITEISH
jgi:two-component system chemotaxis response regulator CheY